MAITADKLNETMRAIDRAHAIITFGLDGTIITANENFLALVGYELTEVQGKHYSILFDAAYVNSSEYHALWAQLNSCQVDRAIRKRIGKGGKELWLLATCVPVLGNDGRPCNIIEVATDVTAQQLDLDDLRDELKVRQDIMNTASIVSEANLKGEITTANDKYVQVSKCSKEELIGRGHNITRHPDMPKEVFKQMWATIGKGQIFRGVVKNRAKDGTPYYVDAVIAPFIGKTGKPRKYLGVRYDITAQEIQRQNMKDQSGKTLEAIVNSVKRVTDIIVEITAASQEQAGEIDQVNKAIVSTDETTQQNTALVEETTSAIHSMKEQARELMR